MQVSDESRTIEFHNRLALSRPGDWIDFANSPQFDWGFFVEYCLKNKTLVRLLTRLKDAGVKLRPFAEEQLEERLSRNSQALTVIAQIGKTLHDDDIPYSVLKFADSYPDLGRDNDFFVGEEFDRALQLIKGTFKHIPNAVSLSDSLNGKKRSFFMNGVEIEFYGKVTQLGENYFAPSELLRDREFLTLEGQTIPVPPAENRLLYSCIHSTLRHRHAKFSEILGALRILHNYQLDWNKVLDDAHNKGITLPLHFFLGMVGTLANAYCDSANGLDKLPPWMRVFPSHVPASEFAKFYGSKFFSDLFRGDLSGAVRLSAAPVIGSLSEFLAAATDRDLSIW
jgi:hypothetical protein